MFHRIVILFSFLLFSAFRTFAQLDFFQELPTQNVTVDVVQTVPIIDTGRRTTAPVSTTLSDLISFTTLATLTPIACTTTALSAAMNAANTAGTASILLPSNCTYSFQGAPAGDALPTVTGVVTIIGGENTVIERALTTSPFRIVTISEAGSLSLQHLTIRYGKSTGFGGAIFNNGSLNLEDVTLSNNSAADGGAIFISSTGTASIVTSIFLANTTTSVGGGAIMNFGNLLAQNSFFSRNTAPVNGGAINTQSSGTTSLLLCLVTHNTSSGWGGGLSNLGTTNLTQCIINFNTGNSGGGIATGNTNVFISNTSATALLNNSPNNCSPLNFIVDCYN